MRPSLPNNLNLRLPRALALRGPRTFGPGSVSSVIKVALDVAYILLILITAALLIAMIAVLFVPVSDWNITFTGDDGGTQKALTRPLALFFIGALAAWFGGFLAIVRNLRLIFRTLIAGDPFQPRNVMRLRAVGVILATVTAGVWTAQALVASRVAPGIMDRQGLGELLTPVFSVLVIFVLAEVFKEGARLRRESELTI